MNGTQAGGETPNVKVRWVPVDDPDNRNGERHRMLREPDDGLGWWTLHVLYEGHLKPGAVMRLRGRYRYSKPHFLCIHAASEPERVEVPDPTSDPGDPDAEPSDWADKVWLLCRGATPEETEAYLRMVKLGEARRGLHDYLRLALDNLEFAGERMAASDAPVPRSGQWKVRARHGRPALLFPNYIGSMDDTELWLVSPPGTADDRPPIRIKGPAADRYANEIQTWHNEVQALLAGEPLEDHEASPGFR